MERVKHDKPMFNAKEQEVVVKNNQKFIDMMKTTDNVEEWNTMRRKVTAEFYGEDLELIQLFGYIDGVLFVEMFKKD